MLAATGQPSRYDREEWRIMTDNAITVRGANKRYGDFAALDNVDFDVPHRIFDGTAGAQRVG